MLSKFHCGLLASFIIKSFFSHISFILNTRDSRYSILLESALHNQHKTGSIHFFRKLCKSVPKICQNMQPYFSPNLHTSKCGIPFTLRCTNPCMNPGPIQDLNPGIIRGLNPGFNTGFDTGKDILIDGGP